MATTVQDLKIKSLEEIRDDFLRTYRNSLIKRGISNPNVSEGTEIYLRATAIAQQIYVASLNIPVAANAQMADTAQADDLVRLAGLYKLALRPAGPSAGSIVLSATVSSPIAIPGGAQLIDPAGLSYVVSVGGSYTARGAIPIRAVDTGAATNLTEGTVLRWVAPPPYVNTTALVGAGGLTGGVDAQTYEDLRARLLERIQSPPNGVNWASANKAAEEASTAVQKAFTYMGANGPSTMHLAVVRAPTAVNKNRDVDPVVLSTDIIPGILAQFPEFIEVVVTTVQNHRLSVSFGIEIPASPKASPPGAGGGWTDAIPFPVYSTFGFSGAVVVTNSTTFAVLSDVAPVVGSQICWLSPDDWILRTAKVVEFTPVGAQYNLIVDTPFVSNNGVTIALGDFVFPNAERMQAYVDAILAGFAKMGPYEKTDSANLLPRALRRPLASTSWPSEMKRPFLRNLSDAGEEVTDVDFLYRGTVTPHHPASIADGPFIMVPNQIGVYPL